MSQLTERLYHYTSPAGLLGILSNRYIFATDSRFVNDSQELKYALDSVLLPLLSELRPDESDPAGYISNARNFLDREVNHHSYIACFTERGDQLSQWHGYGSGVGAISIGFNANSLQSNIEKLNLKTGASLQSVIYKERKQRELFLSIVGSEGLDPRAFGGSAGLLVGHRLLDAAIRCKHKGFNEEHEWRAIVRSRDSLGGKAKTEPDQFRISGKVIAPYVTIDLQSDSELLPIEEVICAPGDHEGIAQNGVRAVLDRFGYQGVELHSSKIPFRG